ncbi:MAG: general secretion pathway protein GspE, partial [Planctomycetota bacterium]|nr:general secretion pathway protein GspE [Planctomycetota bacterium]
MNQADLKKRLLGQILKTAGAVGEGDVQAALADQRKHGGLIGQCLVARGACTDAHVAAALAEQAGLQSVEV